MKKNKLPDLRQETLGWFEQNKNTSVLKIANEVGVSVSTVYNWMAGRMSPSRKNFERLKQVASGNLQQVEIGGQMTSLMDVLLAIGRLEGSIRAEIEQVRKRLEELEKKDLSEQRHADFAKGRR